MMGFQDYKVLMLVFTAVLALFVASPALQRLLVYPQTEFFTELWILGPGHMAGGLPYNITRGESYNMFLGVSNHLGNCSYYSVQVKFRNLTQSGPDSFNRTPSSLTPLYSLNVFVADKETWELPVAFAFDYSYDSASSTVNFNSLTFNGEALNLQGYRSMRNSTTSVVFGNLVFELWIYNDSTGGFQYHERYVDLKFNMLV
jgi:Protein of unknown function (DUF1616)